MRDHLTQWCRSSISLRWMPYRLYMASSAPDEQRVADAWVLPWKIYFK
jgi:hypothetical protein